MCVWIIIILQIYHMTDLTVSVYACTMYIQWSGVWRRKKCHENVRFHTTINKYFMLALLSFSLSLVLFNLFFSHSISLLAPHSSSSAGEWIYRIVSKSKTSLMYGVCDLCHGIKLKMSKKKAHNQVCRYPLRLRRGSNFVGGCCCCCYCCWC